MQLLIDCTAEVNPPCEPPERENVQEVAVPIKFVKLEFETLLYIRFKVSGRTKLAELMSPHVHV